MRQRLVGALLCGSLLLLGACDAQRDELGGGPSSGDTRATDVGTSTSPASTPAGSASTTSTTPPTSTSESPTTTTTTPQSTTTVTGVTTTTTTVPGATTTTPVSLPGVANPECVVQIQPGESLSVIAEAVDDEAVSADGLQAENGITDPDSIDAGDYLDICVGNLIDDITGDERGPPTTAPLTSTRVSGIKAQQQKLNELFAGLGMPALTVDGDSGQLTEQQLCAARAALDMPVSRGDMAPGSAEERALMAAKSLSAPPTAPVSAARWVLIDQTCQTMFVGEVSSRLVFVFPTSTGAPEHATRNTSGARVFRFDPARENGGWHDSLEFPVPADDPLNGNMYLPLYFDDGQAIHGAGYVPPAPQSKGCARLRVESQDALVDWLGLGDAAEPVWDEGRIDLTVSVQGHF